MTSYDIIIIIIIIIKGPNPPSSSAQGFESPLRRAAGAVQMGDLARAIQLLTEVGDLPMHGGFSVWNLKPNQELGGFSAAYTIYIYIHVYIYIYISI